ncbi:hypothetical protein QBC37DRAFT_374260 [Rhypophila decipiens]|uniref:Rhodopsin domain-containing protein n=1 Tax=Rhypophila decipiens TaxID=261697 RepID=A0AAN6YBV1_9PEZI|nr:hypothetical protein QBC37DRAFT_374260 [Rhypophila decipiens]
MHRRAIEAFILTGLGFIIIKIRVYARVRTIGGFKRLQPDDYLMLIAGAAFAAEAYFVYLATERYEGFANGGITPEQRRTLDPNSVEYQDRVRGSKTHVVAWQIYVFVLWTIKAAWCVFYLRLVGILMLRRKVYFGIFLVVSSWITIVLALLLSCRPLRHYWQIYPDPGPRCRPASSELAVILVFVLNILTDFYLIGIPIPMILATSFSRPKKFGLVLLFSGGAFVMVASVLRTVRLLKEPERGGSIAGTWAMRETFVAILMSNIPLILPLVRRWFIPSVRKMSSRRQISTSTTAGGPVSRVQTAQSRPAAPFPMERKQSSHTIRRPRSPLALPTATPTSDDCGDSGYDNEECDTERTEEACSAGREVESDDTCTNCSLTNHESEQGEEAPTGAVGGKKHEEQQEHGR